MMSKTAAEPLVRISKRDGTTFVQKVLVRAIAILLALVVDAFFIFFVTGLNPISVYGVMWNGTFMNTTRFSWALRDLSTLLCIAIALAPAFKMRFWNIGGEGQTLMGCLASASCMILLRDVLPNWALILVMLLTSMLAGAIWGGIPALFKAKWNTNETLFTLMMNYIAIQLTSFAVSKWENPPGSNSIGTINSKGDVKYVGWIGNMFSDGYNKDFMWTVIVVLVLATLVYLYLKYTKHGYEVAVVGDSENTARYAGIRVPRIYVRTMALSGALCGFAGFLAVSAVSHTLSTETAGGRGFTAIIVAWLAKMNPFVMILISALLSFLDKGAVQIASDFGLNEYVSQIISGVILFFILGSEFFINYQVKAGGKHK